MLFNNYDITIGYPLNLICTLTACQPHCMYTGLDIQQKMSHFQISLDVASKCCSDWVRPLTEELQRPLVVVDTGRLEAGTVLNILHTFNPFDTTSYSKIRFAECQRHWRPLQICWWSQVWALRFWPWANIDQFYQFNISPSNIEGDLPVLSQNRFSKSRVLGVKFCLQFSSL